MIKVWGWGAIKERTKTKKIFHIRSPERQTDKPTKFFIKKKNLQDTTYSLISQDPKMSNYCTTEIGHLELKNKSNKKLEICQDFKLEGELFPSFGAHMEKMLNLLPTVHTTPLCSIWSTIPNVVVLSQSEPAATSTPSTGCPSALRYGWISTELFI